MIKSIALVAANRVIGADGDQPLKFSEDWQRFKKVTMGHPMIMGRLTFEALGAKLLPGRTTIVVTRDPNYQIVQSQAENTTGIVAGTLEEAIETAKKLDETIYIAGGGQIYAQAMKYVDELDLTIAHQEAVGDVVFPEIDETIWQETARTPKELFDFVTYRRISH